MKKLLYLLSGIGLLTLSSCNKDFGDSSDPNGYQTIGAALYTATANQINMNLEPADIAFKLNILMTEAADKGVTVNDASLATMRTKLFGEYVAITAAADGTYTLTFTGKGPDDLLRSGVITILTNGTPLSNGNIWTIQFSTSPAYAISSTDGIIFTIAANGYNIRSDADNKWTIVMDKFVAKYTYESVSTNTDGSNWNGTMEINQTAGDQHYNSIGSSEYNVTFAATNVVTAYVADTLNISTVKPLIFKGSCGKRVIVEGSVTSRFPLEIYTYLDLLSFASIQWVKNETNNCLPSLKVQYHMEDINTTSSTTE